MTPDSFLGVYNTINWKNLTQIGARIAQWYSAGLRAGWSGVRIPAGTENLTLHHLVQTGSGAHLASYPMGTRGFCPEVKRPGREADHSLPSTAEVRNAWSYNSSPPYVFMAWNSVKHREKLLLIYITLFSLCSEYKFGTLPLRQPALWDYVHFTINNTRNVKVKLSLSLTKHYAMNSYWGSGGIFPRILWPRH
jgi:hypothetical protein